MRRAMIPVLLLLMAGGGSAATWDVRKELL